MQHKAERIFTLLVAVILLWGGATSWATYSADWSSLRQHDTPDWLDGLKFGIYCHWGAQTAMHALQDHDMSYEEAIDAWTGEKFSAQEWVDLFESAGVQFIGIVSFHVTGLVNWDSQLTDWNSVQRGPKVDIVGELTREARKRDMKVLTSFHSKSIWGPISPSMPRYLDPGKEYPELLEDETGRRSEIAHEGWMARMTEAIDNYKPDMVWLDTHFGGTVPGELRGRFAEGRLLPNVDNTCNGLQERYQQGLISYYFNKGLSWGKEVEFIYKSHDIPPGIGMRDIEDGNLQGLQYDPWMTDINIAKHQHYPSCWFYNPKNEIKSPNLLVDLLVDVTSKNGRMLLSLPPCNDGTFSPEILKSLKGMGDWLKINGEAIYDTIPWVFFGEGPTEVNHPGHHGHSQKGAKEITQYTAEDIRFTQKGNILYATCLDWPGKTLQIRTLGHKGKLYSGDIRSVSLLGTEKKVAWEQTIEALVVTMPDTPPCDFAYCLKIQR